MRKSQFYLVFVVLTVVQMLICNYFHLSPFLMLSILPVMVLCIPLRVGTVGAMEIRMPVHSRSGEAPTTTSQVRASPMSG